MGLLDIFKQKNSVPEKVKTCEKTDSGANMVKEIRGDSAKDGNPLYEIAADRYQTKSV